MKTRYCVLNQNSSFTDFSDSEIYELKAHEAKEGSEISTEGSPIREDSKKIRRRRNRKSDSQVAILKEKFDMDLNWTKEEVIDLAKRSGLSEAQVYKWGWDYKKKLRLEGKVNYDEVSFFCEEILMPNQLDFELYLIQKNYRLSVSSSYSPFGLFSSPNGVLA